MTNKTTLVIIACLIVGFIGTFLLRATMQSYRTLELLLILGALLISLVTLLGVAVQAQWGYKFSTLLFTLGIANSTIIYQWTGRYFLTYALTLLFLTLGIIVSISRIGQKEEETNGLQSTVNSTQNTITEPTVLDTRKERKKKRRKK